MGLEVKRDNWIMAFDVKSFEKQRFSSKDGEGADRSVRANLIGPFEDDRKYFATRYPLPIWTGFQPFSSLQDKFWINYSVLYLITVLISIFIQLLWTKHIRITDLISSMVQPTELRHLNILLFGAQLKVS